MSYTGISLFDILEFEIVRIGFGWTIRLSIDGCVLACLRFAI